MKWLFLTIWWVIPFHSTWSQPAYTTRHTTEAKVKKWYEKAQEASRERDLTEAMEWLDKCLERDPSFIDGHLYAGSLAYDQKDWAEAESHFEQAAELSREYRPKVLYTLGVTEWMQDKYAEAQRHFSEYLETEPDNEVLSQRARKRRADCAFAAEAVKNPVTFQPKSLGPGINTEDPEYLPAINAEGDLLIFTRRRSLPSGSAQEDLFVSTRIAGEWTPARPLEEINTPENNEGGQSLSADGRFLAFGAARKKPNYGSFDLYLCERKPEGWSAPRNIGATVNSKNWDSQPSLSSDGHVLYFASDRPGGQGGKDIWVTHSLKEGYWSAPRNLGLPINTPEDEQVPFIHPDGRSLYFETTGLPGMGGSDLYVSYLQEDGSWSKPLNLGYPINTKANESGLFVGIDGQTAYFATDRSTFDPESASIFEQAGGQQTDIFSFTLPEAVRPAPVTYLKARVQDAIARFPIEDASVELMQLDTRQTVAYSTTDEDGTFLVCLPSGKSYALHVEAPGYLFASKNFDLPPQEEVLRPKEVIINLERIPRAPTRDTVIPEQSPAEPKVEAAPVVLENIFFESGSARLRLESRLDLDRLVYLLRQNPHLKIQINGHTDSVGNEEDNQLLSEERAMAVRQHLIEQGIDAKRLSAKGFGETRPIASNDTPEGRQRNRRTEFQIIL